MLGGIQCLLFVVVMATTLMLLLFVCGLVAGLFERVLLL